MTGSEFLSDEEAEALAMAAINTGDGVPTEEIEQLLEWGHQVKVNAALLRLAVEGEVLVRWRNGEPHFWRAEEKSA